MPLINVEGVGLINFDDSMSREQITQAIERDILPQIRNSRQVSDEPMGPAVPQRAPQPTAESLNRSFLERNILDVGERGYQNLMLGIGALRARSPDSFYGLSPEDAAKDIAARLRRLQEIPRTEASQRAFEEAAKTESVAGAAGRLAQSSSALGDIAGESFGANPLAAPVGILANVTPVPVLRQLIGALAGALNFPTEFATSMGDSLLKAAQDQGVDPGKPEELAQLIRAVNDNPELKQKMRDDALTRASIISSVDALAGYGAGRLVTRGAVGRVGGAAAIEGGGGGVGEAAAQLATEGKIDPVEVAAEILGGGAMGAAGNIRRSPIPPERGENEELRSAIGDIVANRPAEPEAPLALPRERATVDFPGGMLTRTQAENYLVSLEERFPELRFVGGGTEDARGDFDTRLRYAQVKLQDEQERVQQGFQQQQEALIRNELAFSPETEEAFRLAELQRQTGIRPDEEALGPVAEIRSAERRLARFEEDFADTRRELSTAQNRRVVDAVEVEGLRDSLADLRQKIAEEQRNIADLRSEIPESQRGITQRENLNLSAQEAFDVAQQRAGRAGPSVTDLRAGAPEVGRPRMVLNPKFDKNNRLVGGEGIIAVTGVTPEGTVFATVNREVNGVVQEVPVEVNPDEIYSFPMRETARSTQESIAARVGPEQVAGKRGAGVDPRGQSLTPRRVTDRTSQIPETQEEFRPDWRLGEQVGAAPEMPATAPLPQGVKELLTAMRKGRTQAKGQVSLVQRIVKAGGLRDTGGEVLQSLGGNVRNRPGLINKARRTVTTKGGKPAWAGGLQLDQAAELLAGEGYFIDIPTDAELLDAINEELSGRAVNYGPTEDIRGQELSEAARQLDREMSIAGVSLQDSDEDIARALGFEAEAQPRTLEDIEREDEARRIAFSARSVGEKADTEAQAEAKAEQEPPNLEKAQAIVKKFLDDLRAKGKTGRLLANALEAALKNKKFNANQIYEAFMIHEALLKTMPKGANYQFRFLEDIVITEAQAEAARASGAKVGDRAQGLIEPPTESLPGFVNISLAEDMLPILRETGAHEAFHVLQDYFAAYDQSFGKQIDKHFKDDMTIDELEPSIKRRLQIMKPPGSNVTYWQSLKSGVGDNKISAKEAQAYAFGALLDASNRGQKIVGLTAPIQRFFNFTKDFFSALRSGFRGDGFRTPASLLTSATERAASFEQQTPKSGAASFSARQAPEARLASRKPATQNAAAKNFYQSVIADADKIGLLDRVLTTLFDKKKGESVFSAIARTSVNRASALYNADQMAAGKGYTGRSAGKAMEMALTNSGRIAQMLSHGMGRIDAATGIISRRTDVKPLLTIMREAGVKSKEAKNELQVYLAALRERDLRKNGRKGFLNVTDAAVLDAIKDAETKHPNWKQTAVEMDKFNNALIDWAVDTGLIGKRQAQNLRDVFYTPFYRVMEKDTTTEPSRSVTPRIGESFTNVASAINRELEGGERPLGNLFDNIIMNADSIMKAGLKNLAMKTAAETMEFAKLGQKNTTGTRKENTITYKVDGKDIAFDVEDPVLFSALAGMPRTMQSGIYNTMAKMASVFRDFVTVAPSFIFSNLYKGKISAYVQEGQPFMTNTLAGVKDFLNASTTMQNFQLQTGFGGMEYGMAPRDMAKVFERKLTDEGMMKAMSKLKLWSAIRQGFGKMQEISEASEMAERIKLAENLINKGMKPEDAYFQAYLLAPYSRRGTGEGWLGSSVQFLMPLVPFLNAKVQTTYRLVENEKGDKRKLWTAGLPQQIFLRGLVLTGFSLLAYGLNLADDEEKWDKIPPYMKLNYDIIPFMGNYITLPRAFEIGQVFGALPIFILDAIRRGEGKDLAEALVEVGKNTFWMNPIPKAIDPILGAFTNYDFFRSKPLETKGEQALPVGERINRSTTKTGEALSAAVNMVFGNVLSPIKAQALLDGYTGTLGVALMNGFDSLLAAAGAIPGKPAGAFGDPASMPGILANFTGMNRFYREDAQMVSRFVGDFYKIKEMTDQLVRSQNLARQAGDFNRLQELRGEEGLPLQMRSAVNAASEQISDLNKRIRLIERRDIDAVAKAEQIEPLIKRRDDIAKRVVDRARNIGAF